MNIRNKISPDVQVIKNKVPEYNQKVKVENGIVSVITINNYGVEYWVRLSNLMTVTESNENILQSLLWALREVKQDLDMSKAELKRRLIKYRLISK